MSIKMMAMNVIKIFKIKEIETFMVNKKRE